MQIYAKSPNLNPKQPFYKWWAIKSMISNLYIGNGCFTMSIQFKNRLFGFPGTFLGEIHPCFTAPCLWQEGLPWSFTFRFEAFTTYESVPSREITPHHLQMLQKKYSVGVMYIPETLWWPLFCLKFGPCFGRFNPQNKQTTPRWRFPCQPSFEKYVQNRESNLPKSSE